MHLLVLSAFRPEWSHPRASAELGVSMHLLVLSAFRPGASGICRRRAPRSQCTFWCSVLSDRKGCRPVSRTRQRSQCTFWCSVLSDASALHLESQLLLSSQCTFWCSVLSDYSSLQRSINARKVSMHLLVLSAFRHSTNAETAQPSTSLNAPFGAQCFPTSILDDDSFVAFGCLNAPFGAQCFPTVSTVTVESPSAHSLNAPFGAQCFPTHFSEKAMELYKYSVSMHLLVLSAFRHESTPPDNAHMTCLNAPFGAQCFPT